MKHFFFCVLFTLTSQFCGALEHDLVICAIFRDEAPYLKEWIEFHRLVGVEHFYLFNHKSEDNFKKILSPYIRKGIVSLYGTHPYSSDSEKMEDFNHVQCQVYTDMAQALANKVKWVIFLDIDEFLFPVNQLSLREVLKEYDDCAGVSVNWQMFGSSFVKTMPKNQLLIETFTRCAPQDYPVNKHVKTIVQPQYVAEFKNPHAPEYIAGYTQVNSDKIPFSGPFSPYINVDKLRINHYWTRDEDYMWQVKIPRRVKWGMSIDGIIKGNEEMNQTTDTSILKYARRLKKVMFGINRE